MMRSLRTWLLASTALMGSAIDAHAGGFLAAVVGGTFATWLVGATGIGLLGAQIIGQMLKLGIGLALSFISKKILAKRRAEDAGGLSGKLFSGGTVPRSFIMGRFPAEQSLVYVNSWGQAGKTPNAYLTMVIALADLPVAGVAELWIGGEKTTWDPNGVADGDYGIPVPEYTADSTNYLWVNFYDGTQVAADPLLVAQFATDPDRPYPATRIGQGVAYAVVTARVNDKLFTGFPQPQFILNGIPLYDVRQDTTAGGSGAELWADPSTWAAATGPVNPVVAIYNVIRGISRHVSPTEWVFGGQTIGEWSLPYASWAAAMAEADTIVNKVGGTETQFAAGVTVRFDDEPAEIIERLLSSCFGRLAEIGSGFKIRVGAPPAAIYSFTDDDIVVTKPSQFDPFPTLSAVVNGIASQYVSAEEGWGLRDAPKLLRGDLETEDDGRRQLADIVFDTVLSVTQVQRLQSAIIADERAFRQHGLPMPPDAFLVEPLDVVNWTSARNGYTIKDFEVLEVVDYGNLEIDMGIKELDPNAYDWDPGTDETLVSFFPPTRVLPATQLIVGWAADGVLIEHDSGQRAAGVELTWDPDVDDVIGIRFQVRLASDSSLVLDATTSAWETGTAVTTQNLESITNYEARGKYLPGSARDTEWSDWIAFTTPDARVSQEEINASFRARMQQLEEMIPNNLESLREDLNQLGTAIATQSAVTTEQMGWIRMAVGSRYEENKAGVEANALAITGIDSALAAFFVNLFAVTEAGEATTLFRMIAGSLPEGALARVMFEVRAGYAGEYAAAALELLAFYDSTTSTYYSRAVLQADYIDLVINGVTLPAYQLGVADTPYNTPVVSGDISVDLSSRRLVYYTKLTGNATLQLPTGAKPGFEWRHIIQQDGTGAHTLGFHANYLGTDPTIAAGADTVSVLDCLVLALDGSGDPLIIHTLRKSASLILSEEATYEYTTAGTFYLVVPLFSTLTVEMWGAGGGGGGAGLGSSSPGGDGGDTTISELSLVAGGGGGGQGRRQSSTPAGGAIGTNSGTGITEYDAEAGANGYDGSAPPAGRGDGGDGGEVGVDGGTGGLAHSIASDGLGGDGAAPGGGGGGGTKAFDGLGAGGAGGNKILKAFTEGQITVGSTLTLVIGAGGTRGPSNNSNRRGGLGAVGRIRISIT